MTEFPIRIVIGDETIEARLRDNPAANSLLDQLPLTLDFRDFGGFERVGNQTGSCRNGKMCYFEKMNCISRFFLYDNFR